jgi:hypothetical protein
MITNLSSLKGSSDLREFIVMADRASIGLDKFLSGTTDTNMLQNGVRFCESVQNLIHSASNSEGPPRDLKALLLGAKDDAPEVMDTAVLPETLKSINTLFNRVLAQSEPKPSHEEIKTAQEQLFTLSMPFYKTDAANLRQVKERRSLKAYG